MTTTESTMSNNEHPMVVRQLCYLLQHYLPRIGGAAHVGELVVDAASDTEHTISVGKTGIGIDTGWTVKVPSILGELERTGYRVFVMKVHCGGRWHPDEVEDVTTKETLSQVEVLEEVGRLLARDALECLPEFPNELCGPAEVVQEQVEA